MKKRIISGLIAVFICLTAVAQTKEKRSVDTFSKVSFGIPGELYIDFGSGFNLVLEGDEDDLDEIITEVKDGRLIIKNESNNWNWSVNRKVRVHLTMPELEGLSVSGSGKAIVNDDIRSAGNLDLSVSGSGNVNIGNIRIKEFTCGISGSGSVVVEGAGSAESGQITISGSGNYTGENLEVSDLSIRLSGSGNCSVNSVENLSASVSGSGNVTYTGNPKVDVRVSGSGKVRSR